MIGPALMTTLTHKKSAASLFGLCRFIIALAAFAITGCGSPSAANIELRKQNQELQSQVQRLQRQHEGDIATIRSCERDHPTVPSLPEDRLEKLFTTHGLALGKMSGGDDWDPQRPGDDGLKVYIVPIDEDGDAIKAAGVFRVEAFDLDDPAKPLIGTWNFDLKATRDRFYNHLTLYTYVLECPWQTKPAHENLTVKVTFTDELTAREFTAQKEVKARVVNPDQTPATNP